MEYWELEGGKAEDLGRSPIMINLIYNVFNELAFYSVYHEEFYAVEWYVLFDFANNILVIVWKMGCKEAIQGRDDKSWSSHVPGEMRRRVWFYYCIRNTPG